MVLALGRLTLHGPLIRSEGELHHERRAKVQRRQHDEDDVYREHKSIEEKERRRIDGSVTLGGHVELLVARGLHSMLRGSSVEDGHDDGSNEGKEEEDQEDQPPIVHRLERNVAIRLQIFEAT